MGHLSLLITINHYSQHLIGLSSPCQTLYAKNPTHERPRVDPTPRVFWPQQIYPEALLGGLGGIGTLAGSGVIKHIFPSPGGVKKGKSKENIWKHLKHQRKIWKINGKIKGRYMETSWKNAMCLHIPPVIEAFSPHYRLWFNMVYLTHSTYNQHIQ